MSNLNLNSFFEQIGAWEARDMKKQCKNCNDWGEWAAKSAIRTRALESELRMAKIKFETLAEYLNDAKGLDGSLVVICDDAASDIRSILGESV